MEINNNLILQTLDSTEDKAEENIDSINTIRETCMDNVVSKEKIRKVQKKTLNLLSNYLSKTYGPLGSNTQIITGSDKQSILSSYSKDGLKVLKNITFSAPVETAIQSEIIDIAKFVESKVGDGTTSAVILSSEIFKGLCDVEESVNIPPRKLIKIFNNVVSDIQESIKKNSREIKLEDIYDICMISTNGNEEVSKRITALYEQYGFDVNIDVGISNDADTKVVIYDGLTINEGYSDPAYINNTISGTADIHNPKIYAFQDPIDTPEMITYMEKIINENIFIPAQHEEELIPTVIIAPIISRDASGLLTKLVSAMYAYNKNNAESQKPPILVLTNISGTDQDIYFDIATLCGCKMIKKYIDPKIQKADQEKGEAPTLDTITDWCGTAELVSASATKTKFINPISMVTEGDNTYEALLEFLKVEIKKAESDNEDHLSLHRLKKRLRCLEANMIEYLIGGISISDRDALKDLVEDAIKNCASAAEKGVGRAANFEGLLASYKELLETLIDTDKSVEDNIKYIIFRAYYNAAFTLYNSAVEEDKVHNIIKKSLENESPFNVVDLLDGNYIGNNVLCSIDTDIEILNAISKIVTLMVTSNQTLVQVPALNKY